jgi:hypothetical protein
MSTGKKVIYGTLAVLGLLLLCGGIASSFNGGM